MDNIANMLSVSGRSMIVEASPGTGKRVFNVFQARIMDKGEAICSSAWNPSLLTAMVDLNRVCEQYVS